MQRRTTKVRRRVLACARCRKRKLQCDGNTPSCSRCRDAGASCTGFNSSTQSEAPRSIAQYLETFIANHEGRGTQMRSPLKLFRDMQSPLNQIEQLKPTDDQRTFSRDLLGRVMEGISPSFLGISKTMPLARCVVAGTQLPSAKKPLGATDLDENHPRSIINPQSSSTALDSIPTSVAEFLFHNYLDRVITQYPIYHLNDVIYAFNQIYYSESIQNQADSRHLYIISLIMAISLSTAARNKQARANSIATSLFRNAMRYVAAVLSNDLAGLQCLLLLTQYTFLNPSVANLWLLTGFISQACIEFGLHMELPIDNNVSEYERDMRRRIFWCAWEMEVAVGAGLLRPISLPKRCIDVAFPSELEDGAISLTGIDPAGRVSKFTSRRIWLFRQIEAEIISVLYQNEPIPPECPSLDEWVQRTEASITEWRHEVHRAAASNTDTSIEAQWREIMLYSDIAHPYILVTLFRPSPRIKEPSKENLMKAFIAAVRTANGYWQQSNADFGSIKYVFHPCHHSFSSAVVFLQALQRCKAEISEVYSLAEVEQYMASFSQFFSTIAERWPAASRCLEEYERLLAPVKKDYVDFLVQRANNANQHANHMTDLVGDLLDSSLALDDNLNFWNVFNPTTSFGQDESPVAYSRVPHDWNAEFDFGMDLLPEAG